MKNMMSILNIETSRKRVLDYLPEAFFEQAPRKLKSETETDWNKRFNQYWETFNQKVEGAVKFFRPIEVEYNKIRLKREYAELDLLKNKNPLLEKVWKRFPINTLAQKRFVSTLHLTSYIVGNKNSTHIFIEYILNKPINLTYNIREKTRLPDNSQPKIGMCSLGFSSIAGSEIYEYAPFCTLTVHNLNKQEFFEFQDETSIAGQLMNNIEKYYFPLDIEVEFDYKISTDPVLTHDKNGLAYEVSIDQFSLNKDPKSGEGCLGFSTRLGEPKPV